MTISRVNGLDIYYETTGAGPPLVLIHALPFDHNLWLYQVERFSARFRTRSTIDSSSSRVGGGAG